MTENEALAVLWRQGFLGYMGPGYGTGRAVDEFMAVHPRGRGIKKGQKAHRGRDELMDLYLACRAYKAATSRTRRWKPLQAA